MDEVDSMIISQLRDIGCSLDDDVTCLKDLDGSDVIGCAAKCLNSINDDNDSVKFSESMNMSAKYKIANQLASMCTELGYKGDLGYQTFLYGNETDLRKVFLFLIEKLSRDDSAARVTDSSTTKETLRQRIRKSNVSLTWLPPMTFMDETDSDSISWNTEPITLQQSSKSNDVTSNVSFYRIDSIMEWNSIQLSSHVNWNLKRHKPLLEKIEAKQTDDSKVEIITSDNYTSTAPESELIVKDEIQTSASNEGPTQLDKVDDEEAKRKLEVIVLELEEELSTCKNSVQEIVANIHRNMKDINSLEKELEDENRKLEEIKSNEKSFNDLVNEVGSMKSDIEKMSTEWYSVNTRLVDRIREIKHNNKLKSSRSEKLNSDINDLRKKMTAKMKELKQKDGLINELKGKITDDMPPNRASYTKRIMEIINNVKKQNEETRKVNDETRILQKDINTLSGKLGRLFIITDEAIFKEAKNSEWNKRCYKLLATMNENYDQLIEGITSIGSIRREILQLDEFIENEKTNKTASNLKRIQADLSQMQKENQQLKVKYKTMVSTTES